MKTSELLANYRKTGSEAAFTDLLRQYANLVYSVAKRRLSDPSLAEEVAQTVFTRLAESPPNLKSDGALTAWLHRTTVHVAVDVWRSETRRRTREQQVALMDTLPANDAKLWEELTPHLDEALNRLADDDREVVLMRFFERKPMRDIGGVLGVSEDAAKMRVSRALDRLRNQLVQRGVTCTAVVLATLLMQRAVEAAPAGLLATLAVLKLAVPVGIGTAGISSAFIQVLRSKVGMGAAAALVVVALIFARRPASREIEPNAVGPEIISLVQSDDVPPEPAILLNVTAARSLATEAPETNGLILRVVDGATGVGLADARILAAYFYAGGVGERHELQTGADGSALIPNQNHPERRAGLNLFVSLAGFVPKAANLHGMEVRTNYTFELESAVTVGGVVVDELGLPVADVELEAKRAYFDTHQMGNPSTDFQTCKVKTDADGRWIFPYVPKAYKEIRFYLTHSNYAVTDVLIPVVEVDSLNTTLVIERGFAVEGRVTDADGQPVADATVRELHNYGFRKLSTKTDNDGFFAMHGVAIPVMRSVDSSVPAKPEQKVDLVIQAKGMAPQQQTIPLLERTNYANFVLAKGTIFRGRIVDDFGHPITNAVVRTDWCDQLPTRFEWLTHTDTDGRFEWDSAPAEAICFWFEADGFEVIRGVSILPDGTDHEIKLKTRSTRTAYR